MPKSPYSLVVPQSPFHETVPDCLQPLPLRLLFTITFVLFAVRAPARARAWHDPGLRRAAASLGALLGAAGFALRLPSMVRSTVFFTSCFGLGLPSSAVPRPSSAPQHVSYSTGQRQHERVLHAIARRSARATGRDSLTCIAKTKVACRFFFPVAMPGSRENRCPHPVQKSKKRCRSKLQRGLASLDEGLPFAADKASPESEICGWKLFVRDCLSTARQVLPASQQTSISADRLTRTCGKRSGRCTHSETQGRGFEGSDLHSH